MNLSLRTILSQSDCSIEASDQRSQVFKMNLSEVDVYGLTLLAVDEFTVFGDQSPVESMDLRSVVLTSDESMSALDVISADSSATDGATCPTDADQMLCESSKDGIGDDPVCSTVDPAIL